MSLLKEEIAASFKLHFEHFGFKKTTVDDVARGLKISKKTIYQHFDTKEEIFYYIVNQIAHQYMRRMAAELEGLPTQRDKLEHLLRLIFAETRKWLKENDAFEFRYKQDIAGLAFKDAYNDLFAELIAAGIQSGEFRDTPVALSVRFINGILTESMQVLSGDPQQQVEGHVVDAVERLLA